MEEVIRREQEYVSMFWSDMQAQGMLKDKLNAKSAPWKEMVAVIEQDGSKLYEYFPTTVGKRLETKRILRLLSVLKMLGSVLAPEHIRMLSDAQFQSKDFPGTEIAAIIRKDDSKLSCYILL